MKSLILAAWLFIVGALAYVAGTLVNDATRVTIARATDEELAAILRKRAAKIREESKAKTSPEEE
jgi:hypothetical protein